MPPLPVTSTLKVVSKLHVTWATSMPILVFLGLSVLDLGPMYATDSQMCIITECSLPRSGGIIIIIDSRFVSWLKKKFSQW